MTHAHIFSILPRLRERDAREIFDVTRFQTLVSWARSRLRGPGIAWAASERGEVQACGGVLDGAVPGVGAIWLVGTERIGKVLREILLAWRAIIAQGGYRRLEAKCFADNEVANHFVRKFGFELEGTLKSYSIEGKDLNQYGLIVGGAHGR